MSMIASSNKRSRRERSPSRSSSPKRARAAEIEPVKRASQSEALLPYADFNCAKWVKQVVAASEVAERRARVRDTLLQSVGSVTHDLAWFIGDATHDDWERLVRASLLACDHEHTDGRLGAYLNTASLELHVWDEHASMSVAQAASAAIVEAESVESIANPQLRVHVSKAVLIAQTPPLTFDGVPCADHLACFLHACERKVAEVCARFLCWHPEWASRLLANRFGHAVAQRELRVTAALDDASRGKQVVRLGEDDVSLSEPWVMFDDKRTRLTYVLSLDRLLDNEGLNPYTGALVPIHDENFHGVARRDRERLEATQMKHVTTLDTRLHTVQATTAADRARLFSMEWRLEMRERPSWTLEAVKDKACDKWGVSRETLTWLHRWMYDTYASLHASYAVPAVVRRELAPFRGKHTKLYRGVGADLFNVVSMRRFWPPTVNEKAGSESDTPASFDSRILDREVVHLLSKPTSTSSDIKIGQGFASNNMGAWTSSIFGFVLEIDVRDPLDDVLVDVHTLPKVVQEGVATCTNVDQFALEKEVILLPGMYTMRIVELTGVLATRSPRPTHPEQYLKDLTRLSEWFRSIALFHAKRRMWIVNRAMYYSRNARASLSFYTIDQTDRRVAIDTATLRELTVEHPQAELMELLSALPEVSSPRENILRVSFATPAALLAFLQQHMSIVFQ